MAQRGAYSCKGNTLMPDITIYQTLEDYRNGVDTVLEAALAME